MSNDLAKPEGNELVSPHDTPKHSEPVAGHGGTSFENVDAKAGLVIWSLALIAGTLIVVFIMTVGIQKLLQKNNPPGQPDSPLAPAGCYRQVRSCRSTRGKNCPTCASMRNKF